MNHLLTKGARLLEPRPFLLVDRFRKAKLLAMTVFLSLLYQLVFPVVSLALTAGPATPEFSSFEPVATTNMVNEFSGQFVYNVPVLEVPGASGGGYALSLSYHSGDGPEAEASWVGYGWSLNPGSINRTRRGVPDDYKDKPVTYYNSMQPNWTVAATGQFGAQIFSGVLGGNAYSTIRYNNYKGFGFTNGVGLSALRGLFSLGYNVSEGDGTFSVAVNPGALLSYVNNGSKKNEKSAGAAAGKQHNKLSVSGTGQSMRKSVMGFVSKGMGGASSSYLSYLLTSMTSPYNLTSYSGKSLTGAVTIDIDPFPVPVGLDIGGNISYTRQKNEDQSDVSSFGYMYSGSAGDNDESGAGHACIMDYTLENPSTFNKRDKYLPIPFSTPDGFFVTGEGLGGSFRMYNDTVGLFSPNYVKSSTETDFFGIDVHLGTDLGLGGEVLFDGWHDLSVQSSWTNGGNGNTDIFHHVAYGDVSNKSSEPMFFRFNNDLGGKVSYDESSNSNKPVAAVINGNAPMLSTTMIKVKKDGTIIGNQARSARASYVGYHTNSEIKKKTPGGAITPAPRGLAYGLDENVHSQAGRISGNSGINDQIGELSVVNEDGNSYLYGLPVYTNNEANIQQGITGAVTGNNYWGIGSLSNSKKVGELYANPYASSYLLTQITTPDYVDVNLNGPDDKDFGGYTKFNYTRIMGGDTKTTANNTWFKWRVPYKGFYINPLRLSDNEDNMGVYQSGYKEIYYLESIETKTHVARFIRGLRDDGKPASTSETAAQLGNPPTQATLDLCKNSKLVKIQLFAKTDVPGQEVLIKTVNFDYDYSAWPNTDNNYNTSDPNKGRLTLKKVWFEYNGVVNARVSPYQFEYQYPTSSVVTYPTKYSSILAYGANLNYTSASPYYQYYDDPASSTPSTKDGRFIDCWGNYMYDGANRRNKLQSWLSQKPPSTFDPAAWQLKRIVLPSGGEIHVQYEQNTYGYVQDRRAAVMVKLRDTPLGGVNYATGNKYYLDLTEMNVSPADYSRLRDLIYNTYVTKKEKIYFKLLYTLLGNHSEALGNCNADFIDGYASVSSVTLENGGQDIGIVLNNAPKQICHDYITKEVGGKLKDGNCNASGSANMSEPSFNPESLASLAQQLLNATIASYFPDQFTCKYVNPQNSYLRIPVWNKKGGGIRVKRLMMYDRGADPNNPSLYGTEYIYENEVNGESYGVATNEPSENKEENPLVTYLEKRNSQAFLDKLISGKDKEQHEGPLGMNAIPAASVGYSTIIKKNIHQDAATGGGYTVANYYTAKDYPYDMYYSALGADGVAFTDIQTKKDNWNVDIGIFSYTVNTGVRSSQGYCFIQNQMHGQLKSVATYPGVYSKGKFYSTTFPPVPVTQTTYEYFKPGESVPMYNFNNYSVYYDQPGKEMDISIDRRSVNEESTETRITGDITIGLATPIEILYVIGFPITSGAKQRMNTMAVNKVIHYPAILKKVTAMKEGYIQTTENLAFDPMNTKPVLTRSYDGHDGLASLPFESGSHNGSVTTYNIPASSMYPDMGQKARNERYSYSPLTLTSGSNSSGSYTYLNLNPDGVFKKGDMVAIYPNSGSLVYMGNIVDATGATLVIKPAIRYNSTLPSCKRIEVVRSGYTNQLSSSMGGFTEYGSNDKGTAEFLAAMTQAFVTLKYYPGPGLPPPQVINMDDYNFTLNLGATGCTRSPGDLISAVMLTHPAANVYNIQYYSGAQSAPQVLSAPFNYYLLPYNPLPPTYPPVTGFPPGAGGFRFTTGSAQVLNFFCMCLAPPNNNIDVGASLCPLTRKNILKASVTKYSDDWSYPMVSPWLPPFGTTNEYENATRGMWRPLETYVYNMPTRAGSDVVSGQRNYKLAGTASLILQPWIDVNTYDADLWIRSNRIQKYLPNGNAVEELDANLITSTAKYGYRGMLPYAIAKNASYDAIRFESFETVYTSGSVSTVEDGVLINLGNIVSRGHTGKIAYKIDAANPLKISNVGPSPKGHIIKFWLRYGNTTTCPVTVTPTTGTVTMQFVAQTGEWTLYQGYYNNTSMTVPVYYVFSCPLNADIDDIRIQPIESQMTAYVYDRNNYKVVATMDDQNFATYYQYNGEGKLVRKLLETIRGVRTVEEAEYNTPTVPHP
jgi:hypothetical protein